jgi:O-succinylhomoserine sulfhydrylase
MSTQNIRNRRPPTAEHEHSTPVFLTSSFVFDDAEHMRALFAEEQQGNIYSRFTNPNTSEFIDKMCAMEGADAGLATSTGMSAGFASIMGLLRAGDHIVASRAVFGSTHSLLTQFLPRWGITHTYVDIADNAQWEHAVTASTRMLLVETPSNPGLDIADLAFLGDLARRKDLILNVDNTFATPLLQRPIDHGAHIVWHSATKWIDGQGRVLGGAIVGREDLVREITLFARNTGPSMSPFNAWLLSKSLETLSVRLERHCANARTLAERLEGHPSIEQVRYPFLASHPQVDVAQRQMTSGGGLVTFTLAGGGEAARRFVDALTMASITANIGDTRTIVTHPATSTHARLTEEARQAVGITQGLVRMSVGLEDVEDIVADVMQALERV